MTTATGTTRKTNAVPSARAGELPMNLTATEILNVYALEAQDLAQAIDDLENYRVLGRPAIEIAKAERNVAEKLSHLKKTRPFVYEILNDYDA